MINPAKLLKLKGAWETFSQNHPKFAMFIHAVPSHGIKEGAIVEIKVTNPSGQIISTNVKITESDMELFQSLSDVIK